MLAMLRMGADIHYQFYFLLVGDIPLTESISVWYLQVSLFILFTYAGMVNI